MAIYCGVIVGGFGGYVADDPNLGWRFAFAACGIFGMLYAIPLVFLLRDAPRSVEAASVAKVSPARAATELLTNVSFILLVLYFTLPALAGWVVRDWMPAILKEQFNIGQGQGGRRGDAVLAGRGDRRRDRRRVARGPLDAAPRRAAASTSAPSACA